MASWRNATLRSLSAMLVAATISSAVLAADHNRFLVLRRSESRFSNSTAWPVTAARSPKPSCRWRNSGTTRRC